jgi:hypothetical protein
MKLAGRVMEKVMKKVLMQRRLEMNTVGFDVFPESRQEWERVEVIYRKPLEGSCVVLRLVGKGGDAATMNLFYGRDNAGPEFLQKLKDAFAFAKVTASCPTCGRKGDA